MSDLSVLIVTLGKSETYKETIKEKSTILPYSIHKRIHVRPQRNLIQGIHVNTILSTVLKEAAIRNSGLRHARAGPGSIRAKRRKESSGTPICPYSYGMSDPSANSVRCVRTILQGPGGPPEAASRIIFVVITWNFDSD